MFKSVLATACAVLWLSVSAQVSNSKKVLSFGNIESGTIESSSEKSNNFAPFKLVGGLMFVEGKFNGGNSTFILDTGAPGLILNNKLQDHEVDEHYVASGLTGNAKIGELVIDEFEVLNIVKKDFVAYQMDLEHIENEILHRFSGLIGNDLFTNSILMLDYKNQIWGIVDKIETKEIEAVIPFTMLDHFIVIEIKVAGEKYRMILDTGAEVNILDREVLNKIKKSKIKSIGNTNIQSASRDHQSTNSVKLQKFHLGKHMEKHQEFSIMPFDFINEDMDVSLHGLIGYPFFERKKLALDFESGLLILYK